VKGGGHHRASDLHVGERRVKADAGLRNVVKDPRICRIGDVENDEAAAAFDAGREDQDRSPFCETVVVEAGS
jgi:hypothetical protein